MMRLNITLPLISRSGVGTIEFGVGTTEILLSLHQKV